MTRTRIDVYENSGVEYVKIAKAKNKKEYIAFGYKGDTYYWFPGDGDPSFYNKSSKSYVQSKNFYVMSDIKNNSFILHEKVGGKALISWAKVL